MANRQTRYYRKHGLSTRVVKGAQVPKEAYKLENSAMGNSLETKEIALVVMPSKRRSKWHGARPND